VLDVLAACFRTGEMDTDIRATPHWRARKSVLANLPQRAKGKKHGTYAVQETVARSAIPKTAFFYFHTQNNRRLRMVDLKRIDFSPETGTPVSAYLSRNLVPSLIPP
jgi:hypothetical protein